MTDPSAQDRTCPHIMSTDEGTHYCALAEASVRALQAQVAALEAELHRLRAGGQTTDREWLIDVRLVPKVEELLARVRELDAAAGAEPPRARE